MPKTNGQKLHDFQALFGPVFERPTVADADILQMRKTLIREEYVEVMEALERLISHSEQDDLAPLAHELSDLLYVVYGTFWACGIDPDPVFAAVHDANMAKLGGPRRADGKLLKPPGWKPADIAAEIARQSTQ